MIRGPRKGKEQSKGPRNRGGSCHKGQRTGEGAGIREPRTGEEAVRRGQRTGEGGEIREPRTW